MKTKFYFVRHGQTNRNTKGILPDGQNDPLNDTGRKQVLATASNVPNSIDVVISSPLLRASETKTIICDFLDCELVSEEPDERLSEVDFGALKGKTWEEVEILYPSQDIKEEYRTQEYDFSTHGGDSYNSVKDRVYSFIEDMKKKYPGKSILVATHAGIIRCIYKNEKNYVFLEAPDNASVHEFEL
jgi:broad specificity phosphatase PhoE